MLKQAQDQSLGKLAGLRVKAKTFSVESVGLPAPLHITTDPSTDRAE